MRRLPRGLCGALENKGSFSMSTISTFPMKLIRADEHLKALNDEVTDFLAIHPYEVITQQDSPRGNISAKVVYRYTPPDRLLMLIGDVLYNLRSALDHLAWSLAGTRADETTEFPIFCKERGFLGQRGGAKIHDMPAAAQTIIESLQPYKRSHSSPERTPLWLLQAANIENKHHTLNLVAARVRGDIHVNTSLCHPSYGLTGTTGDYLTFEDGAEIFRIPGPVDPSQVQDYSRYTFDVAFDPKGPARGIRLREGLRDMREAVAEAIRLLEPLVP
jgi:hypothetical protein